jgi:hypothetical protein
VEARQDVEGALQYDAGARREKVPGPVVKENAIYLVQRASAAKKLRAIVAETSLQ